MGTTLCFLKIRAPGWRIEIEHVEIVRERAIEVEQVRVHSVEEAVVALGLRA